MSKKQRRDIPRFHSPIFETHCHLDYLDDEVLEEELSAARELGVGPIITIAVSPDNLGTVRELARSKPDVYCTQGIHPHEAESFNEDVAQAIRSGATDPRVVAIGEIGLDYFYDHADRKVQRDVFNEQLSIAAELDLPVVIHSRDADDDTRAILEDHLPTLTRRGVIHSFSSGLELAAFAVDAGFMLGFNGMVTFNRADNVRDAVAQTPLEHIILETDSPYLTPVPYRGKRNAPRYLPLIAEKVAEIKGVDPESLIERCMTNSRQLFLTAEA